MNKSLTEIRDIQDKIKILRCNQRTWILETRQQIVMLQWGRPLPEVWAWCGCVLRIAYERETGWPGPRIEVKWLSQIKRKPAA